MNSNNAIQIKSSKNTTFVIFSRTKMLLLAV